MHDTKNEDCVALEKIDNTIASKEDFAKVFAVKLGHDATDMSVLKERVCAFDDSIDEVDGVENGVASDEVFDVLDLPPEN